METVSITVPASPAYIQVVRLVAAGLASRLKFTLDEIEDLKIAVDELCAYLTGSQGREGNLRIDFTIADDRLEIKGVGDFAPGQKVRTDLTELSQMILATVTDSASLAQPDGSPAFSLVKTRK
ncbi:MAG: serine/threonine-protein kinase RsbW [Actinomycetota bacterium]|jgi:serine/threonine-protein kinase RsbW|nr:serine/threonine-protein kinase RsbW [Actinomycetota bacterium]